MNRLRRAKIGSLIKNPPQIWELSVPEPRHRQRALDDGRFFMQLPPNHSIILSPSFLLVGSDFRAAWSIKSPVSMADQDRNCLLITEIIWKNRFRGPLYTSSLFSRGFNCSMFWGSKTRFFLYLPVVGPGERESGFPHRSPRRRRSKVKRKDGHGSKMGQ